MMLLSFYSMFADRLLWERHSNYEIEPPASRSLAGAEWTGEGKHIINRNNIGGHMSLNVKKKNNKRTVTDF